MTMPTTRYTWDVARDNVVMEKLGDGSTVASYTQEPGQYGALISQYRSGQIHFYHFDATESTRALTNHQGSVTDTSTYTAFGNSAGGTGTTTNAFEFGGAVGYYTDLLASDVYVRERYYVPTIGRWLSVDPIAYEAGDPNLYRYVLNSPTNGVDPEGEEPVMVTFGGFIGGWRGAWLPQPVSPWLRWQFKTDQRGFGGGTYRLAGRVMFDTMDIGKITAANSSGYIFSDSSTRRRRKGAGWVYQTRRSIPTGAIGFKNFSTYHTVWDISASAGYPFVYGSNVVNPVDFRVQVHAVSLCGVCSVIWVTGWHDAFPDFEGRVSSGFPTQIYSYVSPGVGPGVGPGTLGPFGNVAFISLPSIDCAIPSWLSQALTLIGTLGFPGF